jgi:hypothetical protein
MTLLRSAHGIELHEHEDGYFFVQRGNDQLVRTRVLSLAKITFEEASQEADPMREVREKERAYFDMQRARSESFARRAGAARKTGGRGGRGGV